MRRYNYLIYCWLFLYSGDGESFQGVYDRSTRRVHLFVRGDRRKKVTANILDLEDPSLEEIIGKTLHDKLLEDIDMLDALIPTVDAKKIQNGEQSPVFFGSAMTNFGVELFLSTFLEFAQKPPARAATCVITPSLKPEESMIVPEDDQFTGFEIGAHV